FKRPDLQEAPLQFFCGIDFAMGKEAGDYSVIATVAKNMETKKCYVWDVYMARCHPDVLLQMAVYYTLKYQYEAIAVEAQMAQEWFADKLGEALTAQGYPAHTRMKKI